ncbi:hypothetical protein AYX14_02922 [Cryptococcus neoformans]|nr:hypothetical protein AYX14_02922 [Cryptococcus neoformans var. grubii]
MLMTHQSVLPPRSLQLAHPPQPQSHPRRHPRRRTHPPPRRPPPTKYTPSLTPASSIDASLANLLPPSHASPLPQPLILDPSLRFPLTSRILNEWNTKPALRGRTLKQPWILCGSNVSSDRINEVQQAGARVVPVPLDSNGRIPPSSLPSILTSLGLRSVMIEGGSRVLSSFLHTLKRDDGSKLVDSVVVTVAPMFIGEGVGVVPEASFRGFFRCSTF